MKHHFSGRYYKHQKGDKTLSIIVGQADNKRFIQVITDQQSVQLPYQEGNHFSDQGICLRIQSPELSVRGKIRYGTLSPIAYDIMGPFRFFPMECRHGVISMGHRLRGKLMVNGEEWDFTDGMGYMEMDSGCSFPAGYTWIQANDLPRRTSVMAAVARIPVCGLHFRGCICVIHYQGREYRLATYLGVRVLLCTPRHMILVQGPYRLEIQISERQGQWLTAPQKGKMSRRVNQTVSCPAEFRFFIRGKRVFSFRSEHASFEHED